MTSHDLSINSCPTLVIPCQDFLTITLSLKWTQDTLFGLLLLKETQQSKHPSSIYYFLLPPALHSLNNNKSPSLLEDSCIGAKETVFHQSSINDFYDS
jgi:hypothetical protein